MIVTRLEDATPYDAPKHFDVRALRLADAGNRPSAFCSVGLSYYLPGGRAEVDSSPFEKVYVAIEGEITIETRGQQHVLGPMDSCVIKAGEERVVVNNTNRIATLLVILPVHP